METEKNNPVKSEPNLLSKNEIISINENNLNRVINWVSVADSKASFLLTILLIVIGYLFTELGTRINLVLKEYSYSKLILAILLLSGIVVLMSSLGYLIKVIYPHRKRKNLNNDDSYFFFQTISAKDYENDFQNYMSNITSEQVLKGIISQTYNNAKIVKKKYDLIADSCKLFFIGLFIVGLFTILTKILD